MTSNAKSFIDTLKDINDANTVNVKVPSLGKNITFKQISVNQQKEIIRTAFDGIDGVISRSVVVNNIIVDNSNGDADFLIIDKPAIMLALRKESLGSKIKKDGIEYDLNDVPTIKKSDFKLKHTVEHDGITVDLKVPTLALDSDISNKLAKEFAKFETPEEKIKQSLDTVIAYESAKYVDKITIGDATVSFEDVSVHERKDIINNLPLTLNNKIVEYIASIKEVTDKAMTVAEEVVIEIDASFLSSD